MKLTLLSSNFAFSQDFSNSLWLFTTSDNQREINYPNPNSHEQWRSMCESSFISASLHTSFCDLIAAEAGIANA